jgi:hypothetical protein
MCWLAGVSTGQPLIRTTRNFGFYLLGSVEQGLFGSIQSFIGGREVTHFVDYFINIGQVVVDETGNLGFGFQDGRVGVDVQRAGEQVFAGFSRVEAGSNVVDGDRGQLVLLLLVVREAEVTDGVLVAFDTLHEDVVIFTRGEERGNTKAIDRLRAEMALLSPLALD